MLTDRRTDRQTEVHADWRTDKWEGRHRLHAGGRTDRQTEVHTDCRTDKWEGRHRLHAGGRTDKWADGRTDRLRCMLTDGQMGRQTDKTGGRTDWRTNGQTNELTKGKMSERTKKRANGEGRQVEGWTDRRMKNGQPVTVWSRVCRCQLSHRLCVSPCPQLVLNINFSSRTTSMDVQRNLEANVEKRTKDTYGPPMGKRLLVFMDDMNMPQVRRTTTASCCTHVMFTSHVRAAHGQAAAGVHGRHEHAPGTAHRNSKLLYTRNVH